MPATVKRVAKRRSNKKHIRPKTKGASNAPSIVSESIESMPDESGTPPEMVGAAPAASPEAPGRMLLGASCTIHEAPALRSRLIALASNPGPYELDGRAVQHIDTAGVQLVVAFALDCLERGVHYVWTGRSAELDDAIRTLGVGALLESPGAATNYTVPGAA